MNSHFYYDDSHLTDNGSYKIAQEISEYIQDKVYYEEMIC